MHIDSKLNSIFDQAATGFAFIDSRTGRLIKVNKKFCEILGIKSGAEVERTLMAITHPEDLQQDLDNMERLIAGELREFTMEKRYIREDGSVIWGNLTVSALWEAGEDPDFHLAIVEDITARKRAEEKLESINRKLDQRVTERTAALQAKTQELEAANLLLKKHKQELDEKNRKLQELNSALKLFIQKKDEISKEIGEDLLGTIKIAVEPLLRKLANICPDEKQQKFITLIEAHLKEVIKPLPRKLAAENIQLSRTETTVADLIKNGLSNKQIAENLGVSVDTVAFHRKNIRRKLGIKNRRTPLVNYLQNLMSQ